MDIIMQVRNPDDTRIWLTLGRRLALTLTQLFKPLYFGVTMTTAFPIPNSR